MKERTGVPTEAKLLEGEAKETLLGFVKKANASLLVLGRFTRTGGLGAWFLGSTARTLAMHAACPVLVVPHD